uniref:DUF2971 domain-containing protein n=1 Tax=Flavobacterium sp. TaxID=239 RepID=UPI00404A69CC
MNTEFRETISKFKERLSENLDTKNEFRLVVEDNWNLPHGIALFDLVLYRKSNPYAVFEFSQKTSKQDDFQRRKSILFNALKITKARFGIIVEDNSNILFDKGNRLEEHQTTSFEELIKTLLNPKPISFDKFLKEHFAEHIITLASNLNSHFIEFLKTSKLADKIQFDKDSNTIIFSDNNQGLSSFENKFFNHLLGDFNDKYICRYTSLETIYQSLNGVSYRMSGIVGMNDKTEVNYVDTYLDGFEKPISKLHHKSVSALNNRYITSCTLHSNKDNLTMWRLYADDSKGTCLVFKTRGKKLNNHVLLQKVSYANEHGIHPELEFLKWLKNYFEDYTGLPFEFRKLPYWKHFFKPFEYSIEQEVRLLIIDNEELEFIKKDWLLTHSHKILNPVIDFKLNHPDFPIILEEIILGPKCPEAETNMVQFQELIRRKRDELKYGRTYAPSIDVSLSKIKNYR